MTVALPTGQPPDPALLTADQVWLDPNDRMTIGIYRPPGSIPLHVRQFGRFPDASGWLPGDLLLFRADKPSIIGRMIERAQTRGGFPPADARWTHAAVYIGGHYICEAVPLRGIRYQPLLAYVGKHHIRIRRDPHLTEGERYRIAIQAITRLKEGYGFREVAELAAQAYKGYWHRPSTFIAARRVVCSQLYADAYTAVLGAFATNQPTRVTTPADLSMSLKLQDVPCNWLKL